MIRKFKFVGDYLEFRHMQKRSHRGFSYYWHDRTPCLNDATAQTCFDRHYIYHPAWASRIIAGIKPEYHIDISSTLGFCSMLSAFIPVKYYDYRPADLHLTNLTSETADLLRLPFDNASVKSLSCMHVVEHVGLGRYGDPLDPDGDIKAIIELKRVMETGGHLLFVVPVGRPKIMFNAHRIYSYDQIISYFDGYMLRQFALIPDNPVDGGIIVDAPKELADSQSYGCGCFWFTRETP